MPVRPIVLFPNPILKQRCAPVNPADPSAQTVARDLLSYQIAAAPPGAHHGKRDDAQRHRKPGALEEFHRVRRKQREINRQKQQRERPDDPRRLPLHPWTVSKEYEFTRRPNAA